ncbi:hypothetical protein DEU56DRAFT_389049 [Suillus clintonianus]|uniref:uncharacterized protein n=1 Tax=Suillus clintonianus TaxID=1904413 RepID=UPI001B87F3B8|nr:uncharacterized protein DEU56DRAFT_389049 [Suillus clintonianus]KAG2135792.1 hypothetical protein DEU56DRAFT_389049 [Suillus clintonianus]
MAFSITRPSSPQLPPSTPVDDHLSTALHAALSRVHDDMVHQDRSHHPPPDKSRIDIVLDSEVLALKGTTVDVEPALLSGHVVLTLSEATSIKEINLQFRGKTRVPPPLHDPISLNSSGQTFSLCTYDWSFLEGEKRHSHTLKAGKHLFPFSLALGGSLPSSIYLPTTNPSSFISYKLRATAVRPGLAHNLHASHPVTLMRSFAADSLEFQQTLEIENTWPEKLMYTLVLPHRAWAAGDTLTALCKFIPLAKGVRVLSVLTNINETVKIPSRGSDYTRAVVATKHEVAHGKLNLVSESWYGIRQPLGPGATLHPPGSTGVSAPISPAMEDRPSSFNPPDLSLRQVPSTPSSSSSHSHPQPTASSSTVPLHDHDPSHDEPTDPALDEFTLTDLISPLSLTLPPTLPPSHSLDPIHISHRIRWSILMSNLDGHTSELRCSLPLTILDGRLLAEARAGGRWVRRVVLGDHVQGEGESAGTGIFGEGEDNEEEGETLPSYTAHVRDRVANAFLPAGSTVRVANPYVSTAPHISHTPGSATSPSLLPRSGTSSPPHPHAHAHGHGPGHTLPHGVLDWVNSELLSRRPRSPHSNSDPTSQVPSRLVSRAPSPERRVWGAMGPPVTISAPDSHRPAQAVVSGSETHRPPVVSGPETYTHSPPASRTRGTLLTVAMKPLPHGWLSGGSRNGSHSSLVGMTGGHGHGHGHGHGLGMTSVSGSYGVSGHGGLSVSAGSGGVSMGGGGVTHSHPHPHSRSFGNLVSPLQPLEYAHGGTSNTGGNSRPRAAFSIGGSGAQTPYFSGAPSSPHSPRTPPAEIAESAIWGRGLTEVNSSGGSGGGSGSGARGEDLDGLDGVEQSVGGVQDGSAGGVLDGENVNANAAPDYRVAYQGCVPPLSSLAGLPSYEEAAGSGQLDGLGSGSRLSFDGRRSPYDGGHSPRDGGHSPRDARHPSLHDGRYPVQYDEPLSTLHDGRRSGMHDGLHPIPRDGPSSTHDALDGLRLRVPIPRWRRESGEGS